MRWQIDPDIESLRSNIVETRRDLHAHAELGYQERRTASIVAEQLRDLGLEVASGIAGTGVVGLLTGGIPGKTVLLRADMDALPLQEENEVEYRSQTPGVMHACGHDGHTAMLLAVAEALSRRRKQLRGSVKLVFQPAEEGGAGAMKMIEAGILKNPPVEAALSFHLWSASPVGAIHVRGGPVFACADGFDITIKGRGGHAAHAYQSVDPAIMTAETILALQTIISRNLRAIDPGVISVTSIHGGTAYNIIPEEFALCGTVRAFDTSLRDFIRQRMEEILTGITQAHGGSFALNYQAGYPATVNDAQMARLVMEAAREVVCPDRVTENEPSMGGEDFSYFLEQVPGCMFLIGSANAERGLDFPHHHPRFDIDEECLLIGASVMLRAVERLLGEAA